MVIAWVWWIGILGAIMLLFIILWRYANKIEQEEQLELQWKKYIEQQSAIDPNAGEYWRRYYEENVLKQ